MAGYLKFIVMAENLKDKLKERKNAKYNDYIKAKDELVKTQSLLEDLEKQVCEREKTLAILKKYNDKNIFWKAINHFFALAQQESKQNLFGVKIAFILFGLVLMYLAEIEFAFTNIFFAIPFIIGAISFFPTVATLVFKNNIKNIEKTTTIEIEEQEKKKLEENLDFAKKEIDRLNLRIELLGSEIADITEEINKLFYDIERFSDQAYTESRDASIILKRNRERRRRK